MFDVRDANYLRFSQKFRYPSKTIMCITIRKGMLYGLLNFFIGFIRSIFNNPLSFRKLLFSNSKTVFLYNGRNQYNALIGIYDSLKQKGEDAVMIKSSDFPMWLSYAYSISHIGVFFRYYLKSNSKDKEIIANELATFWRSYGDYDLFINWFSKVDIKRLIVANDHVSFTRACLQACRDSNIISAYVQHAAVTDKFPPLITTYSFLDGEDSYEKYKQHKDISSRIYIVGGARFDLAEPSLNENNKKVIGIALTRRDEKNCWESLTGELLKSFPDYTIILRSHPRMESDSIRTYCSSVGIHFSDPMTENSFEFLKHIGLLIANETSTHLDAIIMHRPTILYTGLSNTELRDHYGMVSRGVLSYCSCFEELTEFIIKPYSFSPSLEKVRYFNASYLSQFEFKVSGLIADILFNEGTEIEGIVEKKGINYINYAS